jgi:hypothetical protein
MAAINPNGLYFKVSYNGVNITEDITKHLIDLTYTDNVSGVADEVEIRLEDKDGKWANEWYPEKGAKLNIELSDITGKIIKPNEFEIDEIELTGDKSSGDLVNIKAISGGVTKQLHTKRSHAHENKTLSEIVHTVAARYGLQVIGNIASITIGRVSQHREKDLTFLNRLADEYGYAFNIKGNKLSFVPLKNLESIARVASIDKTDCMSWNIKDKASVIYHAASVKSHNPNKNKVVKSTYTVEQQTNNDGIQFNYLKTADNTLEVRTKTENEQQANAKSEAALHFVNSLQQTASITLIGNVLLLAGNNIELTGFGRCSGIWHILKSTHSRNRGSNGVTSAELKRIIPASQSGSKKKPKVFKHKDNTYKVVPVKNLDGIQFNTIAVRDNTRSIPIPIIKK